MSALPPPLDNIFILIAVIVGVVILIIGIKKNRDATRRLETARKEKARIIREAKMSSKDEANKD